MPESEIWAAADAAAADAKAAADRALGVTLAGTRCEQLFREQRNVSPDHDAYTARCRDDIVGPNSVIAWASGISDQGWTPGTGIGGLPIFLKDNIETADMPTTAGSLSLVDNAPGRDAPLVTRLREAGAVILGKTNLSEWANIRSGNSISGWSAVGGQTLNPYDPARTDRKSVV